MTFSPLFTTYTPLGSDDIDVAMRWPERLYTSASAGIASTEVMVPMELTSML